MHVYSVLCCFDQLYHFLLFCFWWDVLVHRVRGEVLTFQHHIAPRLSPVTNTVRIGWPQFRSHLALLFLCTWHLLRALADLPWCTFSCWPGVKHQFPFPFLYSRCHQIWAILTELLWRCPFWLIPLNWFYCWVFWHCHAGAFALYCYTNLLFQHNDLYTRFASRAENTKRVAKQLQHGSVA